MASTIPTSFLTIPCELRNSIYIHVFTPTLTRTSPPITADTSPDPIAQALKPQYDHDAFKSERSPDGQLQVLRTCRQIHNEAHLLAQSMASFHVVGEASHPDAFREQISQLRSTKVSAIRNITITARISKLRAMNEAWAGLPFGNPSLFLDVLTVVPKRPDAIYSAYADIAYHAQAHTLAHTFAETFKGLRNVRTVVVKNEGCFNEFFWGLVYKGVIFRLWNWGGFSCGVRFDEGETEGQEEGGQWFRVWFSDDARGGNDVGHEMHKILGEGKILPEPVVPAPIF
ncbi:hypothetical protein BDY17DRAFT_256936 [Neohortaea acidophila]|uniref:Uncharacterized protein n=1 Tax=Neohortaea acidophila TaxID=245834 RepID=A0A6A6PI58_9PEZI|nr:uncharacterized protein BDY17DRAFT_256936 [Neohortaea acidophila]KAF2479728.1 hypothetical protein BDY17DRAFT_256936 [Neohortaea acidophila]